MTNNKHVIATEMKFKLDITGIISQPFEKQTADHSHEEYFFIIISTNFDSLMSDVSLFEVRSSLYFNIFGLT